MRDDEICQPHAPGSGDDNRLETSGPACAGLKAVVLSASLHENLPRDNYLTRLFNKMGGLLKPIMPRNRFSPISSAGVGKQDRCLSIA